MLICTLISVFRLASALEREVVRLGIGTMEGRCRWGRVRRGTQSRGAATQASLQWRNWEAPCSAGLVCGKTDPGAGLWPPLASGSPIGHIEILIRKGRMSKPEPTEDGGARKQRTKVQGEINEECHGHFGWTQWPLAFHSQ